MNSKIKTTMKASMILTILIAGCAQDTSNLRFNPSMQSMYLWGLSSQMLMNSGPYTSHPANITVCNPNVSNGFNCIGY